MATIHDRQLAEWKDAVGKLGRVPEEWIGKTPDSVPPGRVRDRILRTWGSVCYLSGLPIAPRAPWQAEHVVPLSMQGMNAERNLRPALAKEHAKKTRKEAAERAKADKARRAHNGTKTPPKKPIEGGGFAPTPEKHNATTVKSRLGTGQWWNPITGKYQDY